MERWLQAGGAGPVREECPSVVCPSGNRRGVLGGEAHSILGLQVKCKILLLAFLSKCIDLPQRSTVNDQRSTVCVLVAHGNGSSGLWLVGAAPEPQDGAALQIPGAKVCGKAKAAATRHGLHLPLPGVLHFPLQPGLLDRSRSPGAALGSGREACRRWKGAPSLRGGGRGVTGNLCVSP